MNPDPTPKLCECGCGKPAPIAARTNRRQGAIKGQAQRFALGHSEGRPGRPPDEPRLCECGCGVYTSVVKGHARRFLTGHNGTERLLTEADYRVVDLGYETPCHIWTNHIDKNGYGKLGFRGRKTWAHRAFWMQERGPIKAGMHLDHLCRNTACVNPDHLEPVTPVENLWRSDITRLTQEDVDTIFALRKTGMSYRKIAREIDFGRTTVADVLHERRISHVPTRRA